MAALCVQITEEAFFPAREREERHGRGHAHVDADVARTRLVAELARRRTAAKLAGCRTAAVEQAGHIAVRAAVDQPNRVVDRAGMHQAQHWAENLGLGNLTARVDIIEDGWSHEKALLVAGDRRAAAID